MLKESDITDELLSHRVQQGDKKAFELLVTRNEAKIRRYITYLLGSSEYTDDIIQETFISAYKNINSFNISRKFSSWLYRISHNKAMDHVRKNSKLRINVDLDIIMNFAFSKETPEDSYTKEEVTKKVKKCLLSLPYKYREILALFYLEDKSYEEIRDILQISINNIGVRLNRGKSLLKSMCQKGEINE